ncbi:MAG: hypothetical protein ACOWWR_12355 [Eubacteriales bacterium]
MEEYTLNDLYEMLVEDNTWEDNEDIRINIAEVMKAIIVNAE